MSHNTIEVNNTAPDRIGDINVNSVIGYARFGQGESSAYSNSPATGMGSGDSYYFYDTSPVNEISGATFTTTNDWCTSFTLPAGAYVIQWGFHVEYTASSWFIYLGLQSGATNLGYSFIGSTINAEQSNGWGMTYITPTSSTTYDWDLASNSNIDTVANQSTTPSQYGVFYIWKVG